MRFQSRRSPVLATGGMVATSHPLAAQAGLSVLRAGGNAADAAVATAAALNVVEPTSTGIGGDCFALFYEAATQTVHAVNGSGRAPRALNPQVAEAGSTGRIAPFGPHAVTVPGAAAGWCDTVSRHGRLALHEVLAPAVQIAETGHPVAPLVSRYWALGAERLRTASPNGGELLLEGNAPAAGTVWRNHGLARVFRALGAGGPEAFYGGWVAEAMLGLLQPAGSVMTAADLAAHRSTFEPPISTAYRGHRIYECAPNGQGLTALLALNLFEGFDLGTLVPRTATYLHLLIECVRLAFADTRWYVADPAHQSVPVEALLSKGYADRRRREIDPNRASIDPSRGSPVAGTDTVYLSVVDGEGNACSFINSNYMGFGTAMVPRGCGFTLHNRGAGFSLDPTHPNVLAPDKRPYHTIIPAMSTYDDGPLHACFGVMGGYMQPQGHLQVLVNLIDRAMDPQEALDEARFSVGGSSFGPDVLIEDPLGPDVVGALVEMGHPARVVSGFSRTHLFGRGQIIVRDRQTGVLWGGSDPRADGAAVGC